MPFTLPPLAYSRDALAPTISKETIDYHYGKHHNTYVVNLNNLVKDTDFAEMSLEDVILKSDGGIFNNAAQIWNHSFYWSCLTPETTSPSAELTVALIQTFGSIDEFKKQFIASATGNFGSGWTWLVKNPHGQLEIVNTSNASCPLTDGYTPLLTIDVWEHAYYIDYRNARPDYLNALWGIINWDFVSENFAKE